MNLPILQGRHIYGGASSSLIVDGQKFVNFAGCNYLALFQRNELQEAARLSLDSKDNFAKFLPASYGGIDPAFEEVEQEAARFFGTESSVYLPSGYHLGIAGVGGLSELYDEIVIDKYAHWCLQDAAKLSGRPIHTFDHQDIESLERIVRSLRDGVKPLLLCDGISASSGCLPPLDVYAEIISKRNGWIFVDESHAAGVLGDTGRGSVQHFGVESRAFIATTLSKAFGALGSVFLGPSEIVEKARKVPAVRGSNPGSPLAARVATAALKLVGENPGMCDSLRKLSEQFRIKLLAAGIECPKSPSAIVSFKLETAEKMRGLQKALFDDQIYVLYSDYIGVDSEGLIRASVFSDHSLSDLDRFVQVTTDFVSRVCG
ncbi:pyridoxal phosphate-dependent aminotransferase family protein [Porticoccaceae bacterium LTM1]|nr:pyridoxal phosphate-dependent aminotransferase family protein [Porticoccaceae bacterium LTM1]